MELRPVVVRGVAQSAEEGGQVAADRYREHQGHADPERTCDTHKRTGCHHWLLLSSPRCIHETLMKTFSSVISG